ncbi:alpha/beta fold hydrolase [Algibacter sp. PT7-4]|uniref:alpha/beta fold hydrolase n=1 Tax=Algibacter ulvanivorans TaxID=3400999 RepID=UPI003AADB552
MKKASRLLSILIYFLVFNIGNAQGRPETKFDTPYGNNQEIGTYVTINGAKIYYEEYGKGKPLLLIHGNSGDIASMGNQIEYFKKKYRVIVADGRGHGKSELKTDSLTYTQMAKDWEGLINHLKLDSINVIGWSDGGIIGLMMGISSKHNFNKMVTMGANLRPDTTAVNSWAITEVSKMMDFIEYKIQVKDTAKPWKLGKQVVGLLLNQPNIETSELSKIKAKVLIMAGDKDVIKNEHSVEIFENIPNAHLCIMPGETHFTPRENPDLFNKIADNFLSKPFIRPDSNFTKGKN